MVTFIHTCCACSSPVPALTCTSLTPVFPPHLFRLISPACGTFPRVPSPSSLPCVCVLGFSPDLRYKFPFPNFCLFKFVFNLGNFAKGPLRTGHTFFLFFLSPYLTYEPLRPLHLLCFFFVFNTFVRYSCAILCLRLFRLPPCRDWLNRSRYLLLRREPEPERQERQHGSIDPTALSTAPSVRPARGSLPQTTRLENRGFQVRATRFSCCYRTFVARGGQPAELLTLRSRGHQASRRDRKKAWRGALARASRAIM